MKAPIPPSASAADALGTRRAALLLHAMAPEDRDWALDSLSKPEREVLLPLLHELAILGIAGDPLLIEEAIAPVLPSAEEPGAERDGPWLDLDRETSGESRFDAIEAAQLPALARVLRDEPVLFAADLLRMTDWAWRDELLDALEPLHRSQVIAAIASRSQAGAVPQQLAVAIKASLRARLQDAGPAPGLVIKEPPLPRWFARISRGIGRQESKAR